MQIKEPSLKQPTDNQHRLKKLRHQKKPQESAAIESDVSVSRTIE